MHTAEQNHTILLIPGLGDDKPLANSILRFATSHWAELGFNVLIYPVLWRNGETFDKKLEGLLSQIEAVPEDTLLSLVAPSAGASLAFIAFSLCSNRIHKAVNVCGRLRAGNHTVRSLERMALSSPAFYDAVIKFEQLEQDLSSLQRNRMMTITPFFGDEIVPADTVSLKGASNRWVYSAEHMISIFLALRTSVIPDFLRT